VECGGINNPPCLTLADDRVHLMRDLRHVAPQVEIDGRTLNTFYHIFVSSAKIKRGQPGVKLQQGLTLVHISAQPDPFLTRNAS